MKVIFLDFDGVLNSARYFYGPDRVSAENLTQLWKCIHMLDPATAPLLNAITDASGARLVISSSWRLAYPLGIIDKAMKHRGFTGQVIGKTGYRSDGDSTSRRGLEIQDWMDQHHEAGWEPIEAFVILDDSADMGPLLPKLVRTTWEEGLLAEHVEPALRILEES